ncbi:MAG: hypothetical protein A2X18_07020 [Bacteroidetes bacterium GWF2_40_14]|nr:MAG: hypothetical protein A2X18_07020 [Bacteroidetes bacterium GWF2_40_14]
MKKRILIFVLILFSISDLSAQWECPSLLGASLKPIGKSKIFWGSEITAGAGYLNNNAIFNSMGLIGLDRSGKKWTIYAEGGYKFWDIYDLDTKQNLKNFHLGIRELLFQYKSRYGKFTAGIQSARLDDYFLLNERILGLNYKYSSGSWSLNFTGGTVMKAFARNGTFCAVGYLYDIVPGREIALLGNKPGQTNLVAATLKFSPLRFIDHAGLALYYEFGSWVEKPLFTGGLFASFALPGGISFNPEILYQSANDNNAIIYLLSLEKLITGEKLRTTINMRYSGFSPLDESAKILNSFSNMFAGNVLRLDSGDLPFIQTSLKFSVPPVRTHLKIQYTAQTRKNAMQEFDVELGKKFKKHLQINAVGAMVKSPLLEKRAILGRIEFRFYF